MGKLDLETRSLSHAELVKAKADLVVEDLVLALRDGRAIVRANAALGLAALGHTGGDLSPFLRDAEPHVARAAAEAIGHLGLAQRAHLVKIAAALDGARAEVVDTVVAMFSELIGKADAELIGVLDTSETVAASAMVRACAHAGLRGLKLLQVAAHDARPRVRLNAVHGVGELAHLEPVSSIEVMHAVAYEDDIADARARGQVVLATFLARTRAEAAAKAGLVPPAVPELQERALTPGELTAAAAVAGLEELLRALGDPRVEIRLNGVRVLAQQAAAAPGRAAALAVATNDADRAVRLESVRALGALGPAGVEVAPALVRAVGDADADVAAAAEAALAGQGAAAAAALQDGLDVPSLARGARVAALIGRLPDGPRLLRQALGAHSVDVRVHAALGLGALGKARAGDALLALTAATRGGNARVRAAVVEAVAMLDPRPDATAPPLAIDGFEARVLAEPELVKAKAVLTAAGVAALAPRLADARGVVRANAALALGVLGDAPGVVDALAVCLRDDDADVRASAARALARLGETAIAACAGDVVRGLCGGDAALAAQLAAMVRASASPAIGVALVGALETVDEHYAGPLLELLCARPDAVELLVAAFERPGAQASAARGFIMLGSAKLGRGRAVLERARVAPEVRVRELARTALLAIDGPPAPPQVPEVPGFETDFLGKGSYSGSVAGTLDVAALVGFLVDGRAAVRANAATALGVLGAAAAPHAITIAALLRDDDDRVRIAAARALDALGDAAVITAAGHLVGALRGDASVVEVCRGVLAARGAKVEEALFAGLDTSDEDHGLRVAELIGALPNGRDLLFAAIDSEAQNVQINAALGIGKLGAKRAGPEGRRRLTRYLPGPPTRRRYAVLKALELLGPEK